MPAFEFSALDPRGKTRKGVLTADSPRQVRARLRERGWVPVSLSAVQDSHDRGPRRWFSPRLPVRELALITRQLSTLVNAGMPVEECLNVVAQQTRGPRARSLLSGVRSRLLEGYGLAQSMAGYPRAFNLQFRSTVQAGEQSGRLGHVLEQLAEYIEDQEATRRRIRMAATYPVILSVVAIGIVVFLLNSIVPRILEVYTSGDQPLPAATQALLAVTEFTRVWWWPALILVALGVVLFRLWNRAEGRRRITHRAVLALPFFGRVVQGFSTARFASTLALLTRSGVPVVESMHIAASVVNLIPVRDALVLAEQQVREGATLSRSLGDSGCFSPMIVHMVASGEASGRLDDLLGRAARQQEQQLKDLIATLVGLLEPLMLVLMGAVVLVIVTAVVLPLTQMSAMV